MRPIEFPPTSHRLYMLRECPGGAHITACPGKRRGYQVLNFGAGEPPSLVPGEDRHSDPFTSLDQIAYSILMDLGLSQRDVDAHWRAFRDGYIAKLKGEWNECEKDIRAWLKANCGETKAL